MASANAPGIRRIRVGDWNAHKTLDACHDDGVFNQPILAATCTLRWQLRCVDSEAVENALCMGLRDTYDVSYTKYLSERRFGSSHVSHLHLTGPYERKLSAVRLCAPNFALHLIPGVS
jgi:hypothetical protein